MLVLVGFTREWQLAWQSSFEAMMAAAASTGGWWSGLVPGAKQGDVDEQSAEGGAWFGLGGAGGTYVCNPGLHVNRFLPCETVPAV